MLEKAPLFRTEMKGYSKIFFPKASCLEGGVTCYHKERYIIKMKEPIKITTPLTKKVIKKLCAGDEVLITGRIFTARDLAHQLLYEALKKKKKFQLDFKGELIYYTGPTGTPQGKVIGSCGPTTSSRMDKFTPSLLAVGLSATMGKGKRGEEMRCAIKKFKAVYFAAPAGCGAYLSQKVKKANVIMYKELGPEAVFSLEVENFPAVVAIDCRGKSVYK